MQCKIRRASAADMAAIKSLLQQLHLPVDDIDPPMLQNFIIAQQDQLIVGVIGLELAGKDALVRSLAITPRLQRRGIGPLLFKAAHGLAHARGVTDLYLLTTTAEHFSARHGFKRIDRKTVPAGLQKFPEFTQLCSATAVCMHRAL